MMMVMMMMMMMMMMIEHFPPKEFSVDSEKCKSVVLRKEREEMVIQIRGREGISLLHYTSPWRFKSSYVLRLYTLPSSSSSSSVVSACDNSALPSCLSFSATVCAHVRAPRRANCCVLLSAS